ncbi:hypothetical protein AGLY_003514 [Aphis glycines]|uniref:Uncharacterized protein n=1 Tax=Aphis glycines TaxID=307491 RepID=A0A6G0U092_APHGL|nr:hypothetical protein AGLY_003514 [Aphis glycines]
MLIVDKKFLDDQKLKFLRNLSKTRKFASNFERNDNDLSQTILNICYYSKSVIRRYLKILPVIKIRVFFTVDKIFLAQSKYLKMHNFFLLAFEVQILTKIPQKHEYLQIILKLLNKKFISHVRLYNTYNICVINKYKRTTLLHTTNICTIANSYGAMEWVPFCCTLGGEVDLGLGYLYKHFYELYLQNNLQIFMLLRNFCQYLNFKC